MSQENVDLVKRSIDVYNRRDLEALREFNHPDMVLDWSASVGWNAEVFRGREAVMRFYTDRFEAFEEIILVPDCLIDAGQSVVVPNVAHQRGRNGAKVSARSTLVFTVHDRKITRICLYQETEQALKAVGLEE
jgi:ketosteroid isomerase-like protein